MDVEKYRAPGQSHPQVVYQDYPGFTFDHRIPLIICIYLFIPAITIIIIRDWYSRANQSRAERFSLQAKCTGYYTACTIAALCYLASAYTYDKMLYFKLYIITAYFMSLFLVLLSFGWKRHKAIRYGIIIAYTGICLSFLVIATMFFYGDADILDALYNVALLIFVCGIVFAFMKATA